ncbi:ead/Ea22-like family protein [Citrobacter sp. CK191]|uniref:ead/Ea22-like family protein n=1 Tax=Citrobacter sp. CK191 TaxID=2985100 RepID=UPI00257529F6|nr:ead/Ea22-like family protein [Citrobacter sp. CK191]MDM3009566.1 ead/Ea22-like family protein [Citrobacter sp. CK191]
MSNIDKRALREAADAANKTSWGRWESYHPHKGARGYEVKVGVKAIAQHCLKVDSVFIAAANPSTVLALLDELEASQSENERLAKALTERNGEPVEGLVKRVTELEEIATDYGMKFQRAQDALKHQSLLHKSQLEAAEKYMAELRDWNAGLAQESFERQQRIAEFSGQKRLIGWRASDYTDETSDPELAKNWAAAIGVLPIFEGDVNTKLAAAGIGKGE